MPLSTGATWNDLTAGKKAKASEVLENMAWGGEGHLYPHFSGTTANNTYDLGDSSNTWRKGFFGTNIEVGGKTLTASGIGEAVDCWLWSQLVGGNVFTINSFNVSSLVWGTTGLYNIAWTTPFSSAEYCAVASQNNGIRITACVNLSTTVCRIDSFNLASGRAEADKVFVIAIGDQ